MIKKFKCAHSNDTMIVEIEETGELSFVINGYQSVILDEESVKKLKKLLKRYFKEVEDRNEW